MAHEQWLLYTACHSGQSPTGILAMFEPLTINISISHRQWTAAERKIKTEYFQKKKQKHRVM